MRALARQVGGRVRRIYSGGGDAGADAAADADGISIVPLQAWSPRRAACAVMLIRLYL